MPPNIHQMTTTTRLDDLLARLRATGPIGTWGPVNVETSVDVGSFPIQYHPHRDALNKITHGVSGVAFNLAAALHALGNEVMLSAVIGQDPIGKYVLSRITPYPRITVFPTYVQQTAQTVVLYDELGRREMFFDRADTDTSTLPLDAVQRVSQVTAAMFSNHRMSTMPIERARELGIPTVADVQTMHALDDEHNQHFCKHADIVFASDALVGSNKESWLRNLARTFDLTIAVLGMGAGGSLLTIDQGASIQLVPAYDLRPVLSTVGAGDALAAAFVDGLHRGIKPLEALHRASVFAGYKVGEVGGSAGFLSAEELDTHLAHVR